VIFLGLGMFVSVIQAFVFTLLSTIYIALAVEHHDDH
jgi:F0F1-type ATP synthase membrane subunit a